MLCSKTISTKGNCYKDLIPQNCLLHDNVNYEIDIDFREVTVKVYNKDNDSIAFESRGDRELIDRLLVRFVELS